MAGVRKGKYCSFCGRSDKEVGFLLAGLEGAICNECVERAAEIVQETKPSVKKEPMQLGQIPKPRKIKNSLMIM